MSDTDLIRAAQEGDLNAFNRLVLDYQDLVYRHAFYYMKDGDAASDVAQEVFIKAFHALSNFRGGSFKAWLLKMTANAAYDELRRNKRHNHLPLYPVIEDEDEMDSSPWVVDKEAQPEIQLEQAETQQTLWRMILALPQKYRDVVVMVDLQELNYDEAAQTLDVPVGTIKSRLARGRLLLRSHLIRNGGQTGLIPSPQHI